MLMFSVSKTRPNWPSGTTQLATKGGSCSRIQSQNASSANVRPALYTVTIFSKEASASGGSSSRTLLMAS